MKKILFILLMVCATASTMTSCTEEEVAPVKETNNSGGSPIDPR